MTQSRSLSDFLHGLISDGAARARFHADPIAALAAGGVVATSPRDVYDALVRIGDEQDLAQGADRDFGRGRERGTDVLNVPPPPPPEYFADQDAHSAAARYLDNYVSSSFDDDLGPFTGSSAERGAAGSGDDQPYGYDSGGHDSGGHDGVGHDYPAHDYPAHDYPGTDTVHDYSGQADPGDHSGFDPGGH